MKTEKPGFLKNPVLEERPQCSLTLVGLQLFADSMFLKTHIVRQKFTGQGFDIADEFIIHEIPSGLI
jgi:hypothetical protein